MMQPPRPWRHMTPAEKGALLLAHHDGKEIEFWNIDRWCGASHPKWRRDVAYREKPKPVIKTRTGECWAYAYEHLEPTLCHNNLGPNCVQGKWTLTERDGKPVRIVWEAAE